MAACGSLQQIFEKPLPENPTLPESLNSPWNQIIKSSKPINEDDLNSSSFTEIFGELHSKEIKNEGSEDYSSPVVNNRKQYHHHHRNSHDSFSSMNSESLQFCTEGLGFESFDDVEGLKIEFNGDCQSQEENTTRIAKRNESFSRSKTSGGGGGGGFPPPISCIGKSGKPWVCFKSYRQDGRFVLKEIRIPTQEFLQATREDGRLRLQFFQSEEEEDDDDDDDDYDYGGRHHDKIDGTEEEEEEEEDDDADADAENTQMTTIDPVGDDDT